MTDIKKKAEEWAIENLSGYCSYGRSPAAGGMAIAAYLAGAKERDRFWASKYHATKATCWPWKPIDLLGEQNQKDLDDAAKKTLEES